MFRCIPRFGRFRLLKITTALLTSDPARFNLQPSAHTRSYEETFTFPSIQDPLCWWQVEINRPDKANAMNASFFAELRECFDSLGMDPACRAIVLCGSGEVTRCSKHLRLKVESTRTQETCYSFDCPTSYTGTFIESDQTCIGLTNGAYRVV